jgi:hypothetical protein
VDYFQSSSINQTASSTSNIHFRALAALTDLGALVDLVGENDSDGESDSDGTSDGASESDGAGESDGDLELLDLETLTSSLLSVAFSCSFMGWIELCKSIAFVEEARRQRIAKLIAAGEIVFILAGLRLSYSGTDQSLGVMPTIYKYASERSQQRMYTGAGGR